MRPGFKFHLSSIQVVILRDVRDDSSLSFYRGPVVPSVIPALVRLSLKDSECKDIPGHIMRPPLKPKQARCGSSYLQS